MDVKQLFDDMKKKGLDAALVSASGTFYSTFELEDPAPSIAQYLDNNSRLLLAELNDSPSEIEVAAGEKSALLTPMGEYTLVCMVKSAADRKHAAELAKALPALMPK